MTAYVVCHQCGETFRPAKGGHNARYCSSRCKARAKRYREGYDPSARAKSYERTKADPERYNQHLATGRRGRAAARNWLADYKLEKGCVDCGYKEHHAALQLDHEGPKTVSIADARSSLKRLKKEIKNGKCVVRCAVCHAIRTWERKQHGVSSARIHAMADVEGVDRSRLDAAFVAFTWAVDDLRETIAAVDRSEVTSGA